MIGLDGKVYGHCDPFPSNEYSCRFLATWMNGYRKFRCYTKFTAAQINEARTGGRRRSLHELAAEYSIANSDPDKAEDKTEEKTEKGVEDK